jgi:hypothetical protein
MRIVTLFSHCNTIGYVQRDSSRSLSAPAQCRRTRRGECESGSQKSGLRGCSAPCRNCRGKIDSRNPFSLPRLHGVYCLRLASYGISKGQGSESAFFRLRRIFSEVIGRHPGGLFPRSPTRARCLASPPARSTKIASYFDPSICAYVSGSFKFTTHPSSLVRCSYTSALCAQTTLRAPRSSGAFASSSYKAAEKITGCPRRP